MPPDAKLIALAIIEHMDPHELTCAPSRAWLQQVTGLTEWRFRKAWPDACALFSQQRRNRKPTRLEAAMSDATAELAKLLEHRGNIGEAAPLTEIRPQDLEPVAPATPLKSAPASEVGYMLANEQRPDTTSTPPAKPKRRVWPSQALPDASEVAPPVDTPERELPPIVGPNGETWEPSGPLDAEPEWHAFERSLMEARPRAWRDADHERKWKDQEDKKRVRAGYPARNEPITTPDQGEDITPRNETEREAHSPREFQGEDITHRSGAVKGRHTHPEDFEGRISPPENRVKGRISPPEDFEGRHTPPDVESEREDITPRNARGEAHSPRKSSEREAHSPRNGTEGECHPPTYSGKPRSRWRQAQDVVPQEGVDGSSRAGARVGACASPPSFKGDSKKVANKEKGREVGSARENDTLIFRGKHFSVTASQLEELRRDFPKAFKGHDHPATVLRRADADIGVYSRSKAADGWDQLIFTLGKYEQWAVQDEAKGLRDEDPLLKARRTGRITGAW